MKTQTIKKLLLLFIVFCTVMPIGLTQVNGYKSTILTDYDDDTDYRDTHYLITKQALIMLKNDKGIDFNDYFDLIDIVEILDLASDLMDLSFPPGQTHFHHYDVHDGIFPYGVGESAADIAQDKAELAGNELAENRPGGAFFKLGEILHLLQDLTVPYHALTIAGTEYPFDHAPYEAYFLTDDFITGYEYRRDHDFWNTGGIYHFEPHEDDNHYTDDDTWGWCDYAAHSAIPYEADVLAGNRAIFPFMAWNLFDFAIRLTAGYLNFFAEKYLRLYEPLTVSITTPRNGGYYSGTITIQATASPDFLIEKLRCLVGGYNLGYDTSSPYAWSFNTKLLSNGWKTITVTAFDRTGRTATKYINIYVNNPTPPPPDDGGGCPILSVYNGSEYVEEGLLNIHDADGIDVLLVHELETDPDMVRRKYMLRLTEHPLTYSHIDQVKLYGRLSDGRLIKLRLTSAIHSSLGRVQSILRKSDNRKVILLGASHNSGVSETIDLKFRVPMWLHFNAFLFEIEGHNRIVK